MLSGIALLFIFLHQLPEYQAFRSGLWSLRKCYWQYNHPWVCLDCIADHIALIVSLWSYRWLHFFDRFNCSDRIAGPIDNCIALIALIALTVSLVISLWFSCSEIFSAFGIILTICSSNCEWPKTEFTVLMNHALTSNHPPGLICVHWIAESSRVTSRPSSLASPLLCGWLKRKLMLTSQESGLPRPIGRLLHRSLRLHQWFFCAERKNTPLAPPPPNLERRWSANSLLSLCSSIFAQSATAHWDTQDFFLPKRASANWLKRLYPS